jgi:hypothetical protein
MESSSVTSQFSGSGSILTVPVGCEKNIQGRMGGQVRTTVTANLVTGKVDLGVR